MFSCKSKANWEILEIAEKLTCHKLLVLIVLKGSHFISKNVQVLQPCNSLLVLFLKN